MDIRDIQNKLDEINNTIREIEGFANSAHSSISESAGKIEGLEYTEIINAPDAIRSALGEAESAMSMTEDLQYSAQMLSSQMDEINSIIENIPAPTATDLLSNISVDINATINGETVTLRGTFAPVTQAHEVPAPVEENMTAEEKLRKAVTGRDVIEALGGE